MTLGVNLVSNMVAMATFAITETKFVGDGAIIRVISNAIMMT